MLQESVMQAASFCASVCAERIIQHRREMLQRWSDERKELLEDRGYYSGKVEGVKATTPSDSVLSQAAPESPLGAECATSPPFDACNSPFSTPSFSPKAASISIGNTPSPATQAAVWLETQEAVRDVEESTHAANHAMDVLEDLLKSFPASSTLITTAKLGTASATSVAASANGSSKRDAAHDPVSAPSTSAIEKGAPDPAHSVQGNADAQGAPETTHSLQSSADVHRKTLPPGPTTHSSQSSADASRKTLPAGTSTTITAAMKEWFQEEKTVIKEWFQEKNDTATDTCIDQKKASSKESTLSKASDEKAVQQKAQESSSQRPDAAGEKAPAKADSAPVSSTGTYKFPWEE